MKQIIKHQQRINALLQDQCLRGLRLIFLCLLVLLQAMVGAHAATNTGLAGDDRHAGPFPIGFEFTYWGKTYTSFYASTNGLLQFANPSSAYNNSCLSSPGLYSTIFAYWDDLRTDVSGQVSGTIQYETTGEAPHRQLIVQWTNMYFYGSNLPMGTFQAVLTEGTNTVALNYRYLLGANSQGSSATIGMNSDTGAFSQIGCNTPNAIHEEQSILYTPDGEGGYTVDAASPYQFTDISGLTAEKPQPTARYTSTSPAWAWTKHPALNLYEIEIQDGSGVVVHSATVGNAGRYEWAAGWTEGTNYRARVRGSINNGGTWELWSDYSSQTTVDQTPPQAVLSSFQQTSQTQFSLTYQAQDSLSGVAGGQVVVAADADFSQVLLTQVVNSASGSVSVDIPSAPAKLFARYEVSDVAGNAAVSPVLAWDVLPAPVLTAPVADAVVNRLPMLIQGQAFPSSEVRIYLDQKQIALTTADQQGLFSLEWAGVLTEGPHLLHAVSLFLNGNSGPGAATAFTYTRPPGPQVSATFAGVALVDAVNTITEPGMLVITAQSAAEGAGIGLVDIRMDGEFVYQHVQGGNPTSTTSSRFFDFAAWPNGEHTLSIKANGADGGQTTAVFPLLLALTAPPAPVITSPANEATVSVAQTRISGTAQLGALVQILVDEKPAGNPVAVDAEGKFSATVTFPAEGSYQVSAQASNSRGTGPASSAVGITYSISAPTITFVTPDEGAVLSVDTAIEVSASDANGITKVELFVGNQSIASLSSPPWRATWSLDDVSNGTYTLSAQATNGRGKTAQTARTVQVQKPVGKGPTVALTFAGQELVDHITITAPGTLAMTAQSDAGITNIRVVVSGMQIFNSNYNKTSPVTGSQFVDFAQVPNGQYQFNITVTDAEGLSTVLNIPFTLNMVAPPAPVITQPSAGAAVTVPQVTVAGTAMAGSQVQLFLNGQTTGSAISVGANGRFSGSITLPAEGSYQIEATASNARGSSPKSEAVSVSYASAAPSVSFVTPAANTVLAAPTTVSVFAAAQAGIAKVDIYVNDSLLGSATQTPYSAQWAVDKAADGAYTLKAVATDTNGKTATATINVSVQKIPVAPEVPKTPYTGTVSSITPTLSYGSQPIVITGAAVSRSSQQPMANAALRMVLDVAGYQRRINLATDAAGQFRYEFVPSANDNGTYIVSVVHPEEASTAEQGRFTINRLSFDLASYNLTAARNFATPVTIHARASAGTGATGVRWAVVPTNQPSGSLPPGISVDVGAPVDVAAGASVPMVVKFTGSASAGETGTVILTAFAAETGETERGSFALNYKLVQASPDLFAKPTYIETGVQQESTVTESVVIGNRGLVAAQNVQVKLVDSNGKAPPDWVFLASGNQIGAVDVGGQVPIQVTASPGKTVADGIYNFKLLVTASNSGEGTIPVSVAVTQSGQGGVSFHVTDLFTESLDANNQPIKGVANARIRLQNDAVLTYLRTLTTDADGKAVLTDLPPGTYTYRASGPRHSDKSGRIFVRPGITVSERVHLQYQTISIDFSVTETTVQDVYDINLEATFQTQVPAPVILLEPLSINLPDLQVGEELTGELTLTNYGLIQAEQVAFTPPQSDEYYKYEFLADVPKVLAAKQRVVIPYRITAIKLHPKSIGFTQTNAGEFAAVQRAVANTFSAKASSCSTYSVWAKTECVFECINGEWENRQVFAQYNRFVGTYTACSGGSSGGWGGSGGWAGGWGGGSGGSGTALPLAPECTPHCRGECCARSGSGGGGSGGK